MAEHFRGLVERTHRFDNTKNSRDDAEGRQSFGNADHRLIRLELVARKRVDFFIHKRFDFM
ncbi:hypothetical protein D3C80_1992730 [compost metagenome]